MVISIDIIWSPVMVKCAWILAQPASMTTITTTRGKAAIRILTSPG
jgi:hypothetical protein